MNNSDHFTDACCPICFSCFSEKDNVPHMLKCGHTHCRICLVNLINSGGFKCGECRAAIGVKNVLSLPINYTILRLVESLRNKENKHDEFKEIEKKIDSMTDKIYENQELYRSKLRDLQNRIEEMEIEKKELKEAKKSLTSKCKDLEKAKSLNESMSIIKETMEKIRKINKQNTTINKRLKSGYEFDRFQSLIDDPEDHYIKYNEMLGSTCFVSNKKLFMRSLQPKNSLSQKYAIQYNVLNPFMVGTFMTVEYESRHFLLEFELFKENSRAKQFIQLCLAEGGQGYMGTEFYGHERIGLEGESVNGGEKKEGTTKQAGKEPKGMTNTGYIKMGYIAGIPNDKPKSTHFKIYLQDWPRIESQLVFGKVVRGLSLLRSVARNKFQAKVAECGLIFDFTIRI